MSMCLIFHLHSLSDVSVKRGKVKNHFTYKKSFSRDVGFFGLFVKKACFSIGRTDFLGTYCTKYFNILASELILDKPILSARFSPENSSQGPEIYGIREINSLFRKVDVINAFTDFHHRLWVVL